MAFEGYVVAKILHVFFAVAWIGGVLFQQTVLVPLAQKMSPASRGELVKGLGPWSLKYHNWMGGFTVLTGIGLVSMNPYGIGWGQLTTTNWGRLIAFGLVGALAMLYLVNFAIRPTVRTLNEKAKEIEAGELPHAGIQLLQKRVAFSTRLVLLIGLVVLVAMVSANAMGTLGP